MPLSYKEITSNGSAAQDLSFTFDYIDVTNLSVFVDGVQKTYQTDWDLPDTNRVEFAVGLHPTSGAVIRIQRNTPSTTRIVDFQDGSVLSEKDLDDSARQIFFISQEASDTAGDAVTVSVDGKIDGQNRNIKNVAAPTSNDHAVNLGFLNTNITAINNVNNNITAVSNIDTNMSDINSVNTNMADINAVEDNLTQLNAILDIYTVSATAPSSPNQGDLWYDTNNDNLYTYNGSAWILRFGYDDQTVRINEYTATAGQTDFSGSDANSNTMTLVAGSTMFVYLNGILIEETDDYTRVDATNTLTLTTAAILNDELRIFQFNPFSTSDHNLVVNSAADAQKLAINAEDSQFTLSDSTTGYSALHHKEKALDAQTAAQTAKTESETARDLAEGYRDSAETYKNQAESYRDTAESHKDAAASSETNASNSASAAQTSANAANSPWSTESGVAGTSTAVYETGDVKVAPTQARRNNFVSKEGDLVFTNGNDAVLGTISTNAHLGAGTSTSDGLILTGGTNRTQTPSGLGTVGIYEETGNPSISFHTGDVNNGAQRSLIEAIDTNTDAIGNGLRINPNGLGQADYTTFGGKGIRSRGNWQFLGESTTTTDIANFVITWSNFGFNPNDFDLLCIKLINMGTTANSSLQGRFYFNGTIFSGSNHRWCGNRAYVDGTGAYDTTERGWDTSYFRFGTPHDSTSHWGYVELFIPNAGKTAYHDYATTAYQGFWSEQYGVDGSSRPRRTSFNGFVNSTTSRTDVTGVWIDASAGNLRNQVFEIYGLPRGGVGGIE